MNTLSISEEYVKCVADKSRIYMICNFLKTYDATQKMEVPYLLFPRQKDLCRALSSGENVVTTKPRQAGITTTTSAFLACEMGLADPQSPIHILAIGNTADISRQFITKIRIFLEQLPRWFWGEEYYSPDPNDPKNKKKIFTIANQDKLELFNGSSIVARSSGPNASRGVGGVDWLIFDEAAFIENGMDVYASAVATTSSGGHIVMISTPNGKDKLYYNTYRQALLGTNGFLALELKWYQDPRYNRFLEWRRTNDKGDVEIFREPTLDAIGNIEYNEQHWEDMIKAGYTPTSPWYVGMCEKFNNNEQKIAQELDVSFLGSDSTVLRPEVIEMQDKENVRDYDEELTEKYNFFHLDEFWVWKEPVEGHKYILSIDNSRGDSDDATAFEVIDCDGTDDNGIPCLEQVAEYNGKLLGDAIGEMANIYGKVYNNAFIVVESIGGYGDATLLTLMRLGYKNLYYDDPSLKNYTAKNEASSLKVTKEGLPGFHSSSVRFQMLSNFANLVTTNQFKVRSKRVINEFDTWIFKNGKQDHKDGCHDDTITCLAMGCFVLEYSLKRQIKSREQDKAIVKALIEANSKTINERAIKYKTEHPNDKTFTSSMVYMDNNLLDKKAEVYKANMWLIN